MWRYIKVSPTACTAPFILSKTRPDMKVNVTFDFGNFYAVLASVPEGYISHTEAVPGVYI